MKQAQAELKGLTERWDALVAAKPTESDFSTIGYAGVTAVHLAEVFHRWFECLELVNAKTRPSSQADDGVTNLGLSRLFKDMRAEVDAAHGNGMAWLIRDSGFSQHLAQSSALITVAVEKRVTIRKELLKSVESNFNNEVLSVQQASPLAQSIIENHGKFTENSKVVDRLRAELEKSVDEVGAVKAQVESNSNDVSKLLEQATANQEGIDNSRKVLESTVANAESLLATSLAVANAKIDETLSQEKGKLGTLLTESKAATDEFLGKAQTTLAEIQKQKVESDAEISAGSVSIKQANEKLSKALQDINRQALAGAFTKQSETMRSERNIWLFIFVASILGLVLIALSNSTAGTFEWQNLLKALPFVGPVIWLGWFAARQVGIFSRIEQDYSYKAATAVAFDGYKKEVMAANDEALSKQLLETAIRNFGENPIRLYDGKGDNHASPSEALIEYMKDDKMWTKVLDLLKAIKPEVKK